MTVVAMDGPAGSGKSSVAKAVAARLGFDLLDTGAGYRSLAWSVLEAGGDPNDAAAVVAALPTFSYDVTSTPEGQRISVDGTDVTDAIRTERVSAAVAGVARVPEVRVALNEQYRKIIRAANPGIVAEGRDITTVVAPDAEVRILLTADEDVRIRRRFGDVGGDEAAVGASLAARDQSDSRTVDFLNPAPGVTLVDSTHLTFDETVQTIVDIVQRKEHS